MQQKEKHNINQIGSSFAPRKWSERSEREEMNVAVTYDENVELYLIHQYQKDQMLLWFPASVPQWARTSYSSHRQLLS